MAMADAPRPGPARPDVAPDPGAEAEAGAPALSWVEQETLDALKRLARAQSQLQALEDQAVANPVRLDPADVARVDQVHAELVAARDKASGRFGRGAARDRADQLETSERLLLDHLGFADHDRYLAAVAAARGPAPDVVDPQVLAFARQELASARQAWLEVQAMPAPVAESPDESSDESSDGQAPDGADAPPPGPDVA